MARLRPAAIAMLLLLVGCSTAPATPQPSPTTEDWTPEPVVTPWLPASPVAGALTRDALPRGSWVSDITWEAGQYVAVGQEGSEAPTHPTAWTSADGRSWQRAGSLDDCDGSFTGIGFSGGRWVAVALCDGAFQDGTLVAAWSADLASWTRGTVEQPLLNVASEGDWWVGPGLAPGRAGFLVVAGRAGRTRAWASVDGVAWAEIASVPFADLTSAQVTGSWTSYILVGLAAGASSSVWTSGSGSTWVAGQAPSDLTAVSPAGFGLIGLADRWTWASDTGVTWRRVGPTPAGLTTIATGAPFLAIGVGSARDGSLDAWRWQGAGWLPIASVSIDGQHLHPLATYALDEQLVVLAEHEIPNPDPSITQVVPAEIVAWVVSLAPDQ